ncbi:hypothetical protein PV350_13190 [Streptomyces sp. PA03-6a]|nr:hypothetical protein [Streptomyces sp. PA03-6a]
MLPEALTVLAATGGTAVVQAAGTDAWTTFRTRLAEWFGRGDATRTQGELERLDSTARELQAAGRGVPEIARARAEGTWQGRIVAALQALPEDQRSQAMTALQQLLDEAPATSPARNVLSGNVFHGPTAMQAGDHGQQTNHFGSS